MILFPVTATKCIEFVSHFFKICLYNPTVFSGSIHKWENICCWKTWMRNRICLHLEDTYQVTLVKPSSWPSISLFIKWRPTLSDAQYHYIKDSYDLTFIPSGSKNRRSSTTSCPYRLCVFLPTKYGEDVVVVNSS